MSYTPHARKLKGERGHPLRNPKWRGFVGHPYRLENMYMTICKLPRVLYGARTVQCRTCEITWLSCGCHVSSWNGHFRILHKEKVDDRTDEWAAWIHIPKASFMCTGFYWSCVSIVPRTALMREHWIVPCGLYGAHTIPMRSSHWALGKSNDIFDQKYKCAPVSSCTRLKGLLPDA